MARAELAQVKAELAQALADKEHLTVELKSTVAKLEDQKKQTTAARDDALDQRWQKFVNQAELEICDRGGRKKLGGCREAVFAALSPDVRSAFSHCIRADQEQPSLREAGKDEMLPQFARYVNQDERATRDWYILLCDPSLPEAQMLAPSTAVLPAPPADEPTAAIVRDSPSRHRRRRHRAGRGW
jgi:hypothetical protein